MVQWMTRAKESMKGFKSSVKAFFKSSKQDGDSDSDVIKTCLLQAMELIQSKYEKYLSEYHQELIDEKVKENKRNKIEDPPNVPQPSGISMEFLESRLKSKRWKRPSLSWSGSPLSSSEMAKFIRRVQGQTDANANSLIEFDEFFHMLFIFDNDHCKTYEGPGSNSPHSLWFSRSSEVISMKFVLIRQLADAAQESDQESDPTEGNISRELVLSNLRKLGFALPTTSVPDQLTLSQFLKLHYTILSRQPEYPLEGNPSCLLQDVGSMQKSDNANSKLGNDIEFAFKYLRLNFQSFDADGSGNCDWLEIARGIKGAQTYQTLGRLQMIFEEVDVNNSKALDFYEFMQLCFLLCCADGRSFDGSTFGEENFLRKTIIPSHREAELIASCFKQLRMIFEGVSEKVQHGGVIQDYVGWNKVKEIAEKHLNTTEHPGQAPLQQRVFVAFERCKQAYSKGTEGVNWMGFLRLVHKTLAGSPAAKPAAPAMPASPAHTEVASIKSLRPKVVEFKGIRTSASNISTHTAPDLVQWTGHKGKVGFWVGRCGDVKVDVVQRENLTQDEAQSQIRFWGQLKHPNCSVLLGSMAKDDSFLFLMEHNEFGTLFHVLYRQQGGSGLDRLTKHSIATGIARGCEKIHSMGWMHRNLKSDTVLISSFGPKLSGFEYICMQDPKPMDIPGGTPSTEELSAISEAERYSAPEMLLIRHGGSQEYNQLVDVYAFGILLWELYHEKIPYFDHEMTSAALEKAIMTVTPATRPTVDASCDRSIREIFESCWHASPAKRNSFHQVLEKLAAGYRSILTEEVIVNTASPKKMEQLAQYIEPAITANKLEDQVRWSIEHTLDEDPELAKLLSGVLCFDTSTHKLAEDQVSIVVLKEAMRILRSVLPAHQGTNLLSMSGELNSVSSSGFVDSSMHSSHMFSSTSFGQEQFQSVSSMKQGAVDTSLLQSQKLIKWRTTRSEAESIHMISRYVNSGVGNNLDVSIALNGLADKHSGLKSLVDDWESPEGVQRLKNCLPYLPASLQLRAMFVSADPDLPKSMPSDHTHTILLGPVGSGKTTFAARLMDQLLAQDHEGKISVLSSDFGLRIAHRNPGTQSIKRVELEVENNRLHIWDTPPLLGTAEKESSLANCIRLKNLMGTLCKFQVNVVLTIVVDAHSILDSRGHAVSVLIQSLKLLCGDWLKLHHDRLCFVVSKAKDEQEGKRLTKHLQSLCKEEGLQIPSSEIFVYDPLEDHESFRRRTFLDKLCDPGRSSFGSDPIVFEMPLQENSRAHLLSLAAHRYQRIKETLNASGVLDVDSLKWDIADLEIITGANPDSTLPSAPRAVEEVTEIWQASFANGSAKSGEKKLEISDGQVLQLCELHQKWNQLGDSLNSLAVECTELPNGSLESVRRLADAVSAKLEFSWQAFNESIKSEFLRCSAMLGSQLRDLLTAEDRAMTFCQRVQTGMSASEMFDNMTDFPACAEIKSVLSPFMQDADLLGAREVRAWCQKCLDDTKDTIIGFKQELCYHEGTKKLLQLQGLLTRALIDKSNPSDVGSGDDDDGILMSEVEFLIGELKREPPRDTQLLSDLEGACQEFKDLNKKATEDYLGNSTASEAAKELQLLIDNETYYQPEQHEAVKRCLDDLKQKNEALYYALKTNLVQHKVKVLLGDFHLENLVRDGKFAEISKMIELHLQLEQSLGDFDVSMNIEHVRAVVSQKVRSQYLDPALEEVNAEMGSKAYLKVSSVARLGSVKANLQLFAPTWESETKEALSKMLQEHTKQLTKQLSSTSSDSTTLANFLLKSFFLSQSLGAMDGFDAVLGSVLCNPNEGSIVHMTTQLEATLALQAGTIHGERGILKECVPMMLDTLLLLARSVALMTRAWRDGDCEIAIAGLSKLAKVDSTNSEFNKELSNFKMVLDDTTQTWKFDCRNFDVDKASPDELSAMFLFLEKLDRTVMLDPLFREKGVELQLADPAGPVASCRKAFLSTIDENFRSAMLNLDRTFSAMREKDAREFAKQTRECTDPPALLSTLESVAASKGIESSFVKRVLNFVNTFYVNVPDAWLKFLDNKREGWETQIRENLLRFSCDCCAVFVEQEIKKAKADFLQLPEDQQNTFKIDLLKEVEETIDQLDQNSDSRGRGLHDQLLALFELMEKASNLHKLNALADQAKEKLNELKDKIIQRKSYSHDLDGMKGSLMAISESPKYKDIFEMLTDNLVDEVFRGLSSAEMQTLISNKKFGDIFQRYRQLQEFSKAITDAFSAMLTAGTVKSSWVESRKSRLNVTDLETSIHDTLKTSVLEPAREDIHRGLGDSNYLNCGSLENFVMDNKQLEEASKVAEGKLKETGKWQDQLRKEASQSFSDQISSLNQKIRGKEELDSGDMEARSNDLALLLVKGVTIFLKLDYARCFEDMVKQKLFNSSPQGAGWSARVVNKLKMSVGSCLKQFSDSSDDRKNSASHEVFGLFRDIFESFNIQAFNKKAGGIQFEDAIRGGNFHREVENALGHRDQLLIQTWAKYKQTYEDEVKKICENRYTVDTTRINQLSNDLRPMRDRLNQRTEETAELLGLIGSLWTYLTSPGVSGADYDGQAQDPGALRMPHSTQILGILCLLGVDHSEMVNQLVQIKTGEGKSIALGFTAAMLACLGFNVDVVCYSSALSQRDEAAFLPLFEKLNRQDNIKYRDFYSLVAGVMEDNSSEYFPKIQQYYDCLLKRGSGGVPQKDLNKKDRVILLDEVDVFFSESYYGQLYQRSYKIQDSYELLRHIWRHPDQTDLGILMQQPFVKKILQSHPGLTTSMLQHEIRQAIYVREHYKDSPQPEHKVYEQEGTIVYIDPVSGGPAPSISYGYYTTFLYLEKFADDRFKASAELRSKVCLQPLCGGLLYSKVPQLYAIRLGMTGTLSNLTKQQEELLGQFEIKRKTFLPSTYKKKMLNEGQDPRDTATKVVPKSGLYKEIALEIKRIVGTGTPRAILVIMQDNPALLDFGKWLLDQDVVKGLPQAERITDGLSPNELQSRIFRATRRGAVTLVTRSYGRGTDFVCRDPRLADNGGVHMLMTFYPEEESEEVQIKGRTCRQDDPGSARKVLVKEELVSWGLPSSENGASGWDNILDSLRKQKLAKRYNTMRETEAKNTRMHDKTLQAVDLVKNCVAGRQKWENAADKFLEISRHNSVQARPVHNVLALDRSGSMRGRNWQNLKIAVNEYIRIRLSSGGQDDIISVILFNHEAERVWGPAPIKRASELNKILAKEPGGQTNFGASVDQTMKVLRMNDPAQFKPIAVFMCDGMVYQNSTPSAVQKLCKQLVNADGETGGVDGLQSFFMYLGRAGSQESKDMQL